ncbi:MAG: hypothetical protein ACFFBR_04900 [Promethearchaeota archaeon]
MHQINSGKIKIEDSVLEELDADKAAAKRRWEAYIGAMRGYLSSHPMDVNKVDAYYARLRAEERYFTDSDMRKARRRAFLLQLMLCRYTASYGG